MRIEVSGIHLWFDVEGPALTPQGGAMRPRPTVVLLHGGPGSFDHSYFKPDFGRLTSVAQVVYLDLRGHGRSHHGDPREWTFETCADDVRAFCDAVGIERPIVLGHSLGGFVAMLYGARHPGHAGALVLQSTAARFDVPRLVENFRRAGGDGIADIARRSYGDREERLTVTAEEWARCYRHFGPGLVGPEEKGRIVPNPLLNPRGMDLLIRFDARHQLGAISCPTLVCTGERDPVTCPVAAGELMSALPHGVARLEILQGTGHFPWKDDPERYWPMLADFIVTVGSAGRSGTRPETRGAR